MYSRSRAARARLGDVPWPNDTTTFADWDAAVHYAGGVPVNNPDGGAPAARYPYSIFGPLVNAGTFTTPDYLTPDGQYGYYNAPAPVLADAVRLGVATQAEADAGMKNLGWYQEILNVWHKTEAAVTPTIAVGAGLVAVYLLAPIVVSAVFNRRRT